MIEAIESGLVKIPFLPIKDDTIENGMPVLRMLYQHVKKELPRAGLRFKRSQAKQTGQILKEAPPRIPERVKIAFAQFYNHYAEEARDLRHTAKARGTAQLELVDTPPVFIAVCNNTSVSKEVFKYIAGYEQTEPAAGEPTAGVPGVFELFSNFDTATRQPKPRPPTLLIDSDALENSGQIDEGFKRIFAPELAVFKREYARQHGQGAADQITDAEILREVVNTVGKPGTLGSHIRCVVSVSMLTEGWDANTVTHIAGLRAFGSQLLCEQVAGRALRRKQYVIHAYDPVTGELLSEKSAKARSPENILYKFPPEYAHIIGVPFKLFKGGKAITPPAVDSKRIFALRERTPQYELTFPNVEGYRVDYPQGPLTYSFDKLDPYEVDASRIPTRTEMGTGVDAKRKTLTIDDILQTRDQQIVYHIAKALLRDRFGVEAGGVQLHRFHELTAIVAEWLNTKVKVLHKGPEWKKLLRYTDPQKPAEHIARAIHPDVDARQLIRPILRHHNPSGSSRYVQGSTIRETYATRHSHVNMVVVDSGWEANAAKVLDDLAESDNAAVTAWVKNEFLDFRIPYADREGNPREYLPDFIVRARRPGGEVVNLVLEITGMRADKPEKVWTVENRWLPAVNAVREAKGWPRWDFLEIAGDVRDARNQILAKLQ